MGRQRGDGGDGLIIGRGGDIVWYRRIGEKGRPVLATPHVLVPDNHGSGFGGVPVLNEPQRFQVVCVADFNGDGRLDLLLGDANIARLEREPLVIRDHRGADVFVDAAAEVGGGAGDEVGVAVGQGIEMVSQMMAGSRPARQRRWCGSR